MYSYAELRCKTNFTFLEGAAHAEELVEQAVALGLQALAVTDVNTLAGVVRAHAAARAAGRPGSDAPGRCRPSGQSRHC